MDRSRRAARAAAFASSAVNGFVMGARVVYINVITRQAGAGPATLGYLLLALGGSAFAGLRPRSSARTARAPPCLARNPAA